MGQSDLGWQCLLVPDCLQKMDQPYRPSTPFFYRYALTISSMHGCRKLCQRGSNFDNVLKLLFFLNIFYEGWEDRITQVIIGSPAKHHLNGVLLVYWWWPNIGCWLGSFMIYQGIRSAPELQKKNYFFVIYQGGFGPPVPPLDPHMSSMMRYHLQDFSMSEHLQVINLLHISLYQRDFYVTLKGTIIIFIQILTLSLLFQGMMPHNSHISLGMIWDLPSCHIEITK